MRWIADAWGRDGLPKPVVATIGNFDGIHRGQQAILARVVERAGRLGLPAVVITFEPHPLRVLAPERAPLRLATGEQKRALLAAQGIDWTLVLAFSPALARTGADDFVRRFLVDRLDVREVFVGSRFVFGRDREGGIEVLSALGRELGFQVEGVAEVLDEGEPISSSRIRRAVREGEVATAARWLGRPFEILGTIVPGNERGAELGWPTINLDTENELLPAHGVYTSRVRFSDAEDSFEAVSNVGVRPTFREEGARPQVESHILDFSRDVYGKRVSVSFLTRLRPERAFPSARELALQIQRDVDAARRFFSNSDD